MTLEWTQIVAELDQSNQAYVLITVLGVRGSAPRDTGTKMVVTRDRVFSTIGGGNLEYIAIDQARSMLDDARSAQHLEHYPLGPKLGQCCGGTTTVLFECFWSARANVMLFGAGHVGTALSKILLDLPVNLSWVDNRSEQFSDTSSDLSSNTKLDVIVSQQPESEVENMPAQSYYYIMTHDHDLDFELCKTALKRGDARFIGLIGSSTKQLRFRKRLLAEGFSDTQVNSIHCPVGSQAIPGKRPMEVAVSVAAQFIADYQSKPEDQSKSASKTQGVHWKQFAHTQLNTDQPELQNENIKLERKCGSCTACDE